MYIYNIHNTVDGQNPAPPRMMILPLFYRVLTISHLAGPAAHETPPGHPLVGYSPKIGLPHGGKKCLGTQREVWKLMEHQENICWNHMYVELYWYQWTKIHLGISIYQLLQKISEVHMNACIGGVIMDMLDI